MVLIIVKGVFKIKLVFFPLVIVEASIIPTGRRPILPLPIRIKRGVKIISARISPRMIGFEKPVKLLSREPVFRYKYSLSAMKRIKNRIRNQKSEMNVPTSCPKSFPALRIENKSNVDRLLVYLKYSTSIKFRAMSKVLVRWNRVLNENRYHLLFRFGKGIKKRM